MCPLNSHLLFTQSMLECTRDQYFSYNIDTERVNLEHTIKQFHYYFFWYFKHFKKNLHASIFHKILRSLGEFIYFSLSQCQSTLRISSSLMILTQRAWIWNMPIYSFIIISFDIPKAFDRFWHSSILHKILRILETFIFFQLNQFFSHDNYSESRTYKLTVSLSLLLTF